MSDNNRSVNSEQLRNLRLRQPHAVILHANVQTGLAIGRLVNDNLSSVHTNKYRKNHPHFQKFPAFGFFSGNDYFCAVLQEDTVVVKAKHASRRRPMQKSGRQCGKRGQKTDANN